MAGLAPLLPLQIDEIDGAYKLINDYVSLVKQNFKMLLLTSPGEKIMNPDYGVGLRRFLFENSIMHTQVQSSVKAAIYMQTKKYMPYIEVNDVYFTLSENEPNSIGIYVNYTIIPLSIETSFNISHKIDQFY